MAHQRNAVTMQQFVGKTISGIEDQKIDHWSDPDAFTIHFGDGSKVTISADMGQATGFVVLEPVE